MALDHASPDERRILTTVNNPKRRREFDPTAGFLPPGAEGSVLFIILPKSSVTTGTVIQNTATVVFDAR